MKITKNLNLVRIMRTIWVNDGISRVRIAQLLGLNKSTVTSLVSELLERGIVLEVEEGESGPQGGRKPIGLQINANYCCVLGLEIQPEFVTALAVNLSGEVLGKLTEPAAVSASNLVSFTCGALSRYRDRLIPRSVPLIGAGIGLSGIIDPFEGVIHASMPLEIHGQLRFVDEMRRCFETPVWIENDAKCGAWGELVFHKSGELGDFLYVLGFFGEGDIVRGHRGGIAVGLGLVMDHHVHYGKNHSAGEFKSILWNPSNASQFSLTGEETLLVMKDESVRGRFIRELAVHVAFLVNTLNLSHVFIGGSLARYREEVYSAFREAIDKNWAYSGPVACDIKFSSVGDFAVAYGAAGMLLDRIFSQTGLPTVKGTSRLLDVGLIP